MKKILTCLCLSVVCMFAFVTPPAFAATTPLAQNNNGVMTVTSQTSTTSAFTASGGALTSEIKVPNGFFEDTGVLVNRALQILLVVSSLLVFANLIIGAFEWITSGGDKGKVDKARERMVNSVVGLVILVSSYAILLLIIRFLGYRDLNDILNNAYQFNLNSTTATSSSALGPMLTK